MPFHPSRRRLLALTAATAASFALPVRAAVPEGIHTRTIPSTGEEISAIGMGTWVTFNVGAVPALRADRLEVLQTFLDLGGGMIDSSPMYGTSEEVVGWCLERAQRTDRAFSATKVWTPLGEEGPAQMARSRSLWGVAAFDLMQVHNLVDWRDHLNTLRADKDAGRIRYIGVTTSHGRRHDELEAILRAEPLDFVQLTYNVLDREAEDRLLPLAADRGVAVIANRPFRHASLFERFDHHPLPEWAAEIDCANWAQVFLKFIISHPAVTCAIPATSRVDHMRENMGALRGPLPDAALRARMVRTLESL